MQNQDTLKFPTTSGTPKQTYSKEETLNTLYLFMLNASDAFAKAREAQIRDTQKVADKLKKAGIPLSEFTAFVFEKEKPNVSTTNPDNVPQV